MATRKSGQSYARRFGCTSSARRASTSRARQSTDRQASRARCGRVEQLQAPEGHEPAGQYLRYWSASMRLRLSRVKSTPTTITIKPSSTCEVRCGADAPAARANWRGSSDPPQHKHQAAQHDEQRPRRRVAQPEEVILRDRIHAPMPISHRPERPLRARRPMRGCRWLRAGVPTPGDESPRSNIIVAPSTIRSRGVKSGRPSYERARGVEQHRGAEEEQDRSADDRPGWIERVSLSVVFHDWRVCPAARS